MSCITRQELCYVLCSRNISALTDGRNERGGERVVRKPEQNTRFAHARITDQQQFEQQIVRLLRHVHSGAIGYSREYNVSHEPDRVVITQQCNLIITTIYDVTRERDGQTNTHTTLQTARETRMTPEEPSRKTRATINVRYVYCVSADTSIRLVSECELQRKRPSTDEPGQVVWALRLCLR